MIVCAGPLRIRETDVKSAPPALATRKRRSGRPGVPVAALVTVLAAAGATWYGFLAHTRSHPTVRLAGALALAADGLAAVLLATPPLQQPAVPMPGGPVPSAAATQAEGTHPSGTLLGLLSMAAALIHFSVIEQHWTEYWLYGAFFIAVGLAQLGWALAIPAAPVRWLLYGGVLGNALVVITWIVTRTVGSLVGPAATMPARAGFGDLVATAMQVLIVGGCLALLSRRLAPTGWRASYTPMIAALIVMPFLVLALYSAVGGSPIRQHGGLMIPAAVDRCGTARISPSIRSMAGR